MKLGLNWTEKMYFKAHADGHEVGMDAKAPVGQGKALNPKQLVLSGLMGCTAMDVVAFLRKHRQELEAFDIEIDVDTSDPKIHPTVFTAATLRFQLQGKALDSQVALEAVQLSQTQYCGVSAMLSKAFPIRYEVFVNGKLIGQGQAQFA